MATLVTKVRLYLEANGKNPDVEIGMEGANVYLVNETGTDEIKTWNVSGLEKPTDEQLATYNSAGDTYEANHTVRLNRKKEYGTYAEQLEYIVENGVEAFIEKQQQIKTDNPKE